MEKLRDLLTLFGCVADEAAESCLTQPCCNELGPDTHDFACFVAWLRFVCNAMASVLPSSPQSRGYHTAATLEIKDEARDPSSAEAKDLGNGCASTRRPGTKSK